MIAGKLSLRNGGCILGTWLKIIRPGMWLYLFSFGLLFCTENLDTNGVIKFNIVLFIFGKLFDGL